MNAQDRVNGYMSLIAQRAAERAAIQRAEDIDEAVRVCTSHAQRLVATYTGAVPAWLARDVGHEYRWIVMHRRGTHPQSHHDWLCAR